MNSNLLPQSNYYLNNFVSGAVEVPAYLLGMLCQMKLGRKWPVVVSMLIAGGALLALMAVPKGNNNITYFFH